MNELREPQGQSAISLKELLKSLVRFQELSFAYWEQEATNLKSGLKEIQKSMEHILSDIPKEWSKLITRLQSGGQPAVVPAVDGFCSFCRIELPTSMFQEIQSHVRIHQCPCCARILYLPERAGRFRGASNFSSKKGGIARFSAPDLMIPRLKAESRDEAIEEMVNILDKRGWIDQPEEIYRAAVAREELVSTAVDYGLAFPHVRGVEGGGLTVALGIKKKGLKFGAPKGRLTRIIFFSVIPQAASGFYLKLLAGLVRTFREEEARRRILQCSDQADLWDCLLDVTAEAIP
jgi:mannitol/fructose-specific phosphotransferase system IIA component (Ntr-type)